MNTKFIRVEGGIIPVEVRLRLITDLIYNLDQSNPPDPRSAIKKIRKFMQDSILGLTPYQGFGSTGDFYIDNRDAKDGYFRFYSTIMPELGEMRIHKNELEKILYDFERALDQSDGD